MAKSTAASDNTSHSPGQRFSSSDGSSGPEMHFHGHPNTRTDELPAASSVHNPESSYSPPGAFKEEESEAYGTCTSDSSANPLSSPAPSNDEMLKTCPVPGAFTLNASFVSTGPSWSELGSRLWQEIRPPTVSEVKTGVEEGFSERAAFMAAAAISAAIWATLDDKTVDSYLDRGYECGYKFGEELRTGTRSDLKNWLDPTSDDPNGDLPRGDSLINSAQKSYNSRWKPPDVTPSCQTLWNSGPVTYLKKGLENFLSDVEHEGGYMDALRAPTSELADPHGFLADCVEPGEDSSEESDKHTHTTT